MPEAHPSEPELADAIGAVVERGLEFKCTAGLHHAVRHTDGALEQHGFLNVLLATDAALRGAGSHELVSVLAERSAEAITDPVRELMALGLVQKP